MDQKGTIVNPLVYNANQLTRNGCTTYQKVNELYYDGMLNLNLCFYSPIFHFTGVDVDTPIGKRKAHVAIIVCSTDRPACALVANNMQYNGHFGCTTCDSYGTSVCWSHSLLAV